MKTISTALVICAASSPATLLAQTTALVSSAGGAPGNAASHGASISDDGRFVAFDSQASNLVAADTNGVADVFVFDRLTLTVVRASVGLAGADANGASSQPSLSADGSRVAFVGQADNLVAGDTNAVDDVFVFDRTSGLTTRVSLATSGAQANGASSAPSMSGNGRYVAFESGASNLIASDTNGCMDVFVRDLQTNSTGRVSVDPGGFDSNNASHDPAISGDGRYVVFESTATNLIVGDNNLAQDLFLFDRLSAITTRINLKPSGLETTWPAYAPAISYDGRYVAFHSMAPNLVPNDANNAVDVFVRDVQSATTSLASVDGNGAQSTASCRNADVSNDGRYVVFESTSSNLVPGDTNAARDVFVRDRTAGTTLRISVESHGTQGDADSELAVVSGDGRYFAFESAAASLVLGDTNDEDDVFLHDRLGIPPASAVYCTPSTSTIGCNATMSATGTPSVGATTGFTLTCSNVEGQRVGLFFYGTSGATALPWASGSTSFLCVQPPTQRTPPQSSAGTASQCNGSLSLDVLTFWAANPTALGQPLAVGEQFDAQAWFRDPPAPKTTNLSNAIRFWMAP